MLAPVSGWSLNYAEDSCALVRSFGDAASPTMLELRQYAPGGPVVVTIAAQKRVRSRIDPVVSFGPQDLDARTAVYRQVDLENEYSGVRMYLFQDWPNTFPAALATEDPERDSAEGAVEWLSVRRVFEEDFRLGTGSMHLAMNAMRECLGDLIEGWGLDAEAHQDLSSAVEWPERVNWISTALRGMSRSLERQVERESQYMLLQVAADGSVESCRPFTSSTLTEFAEIFCSETLERGRYEPALDAEGDAIASYYVHGISIWRGSSR